MDSAEQRAYCKKCLEETRKEYNKIGKVQCPCLAADVIFNAQGFHHLQYHGGGEARTIKDILHKLKLFPLVIPVLKYASSIAEYNQTLEPKNRKSAAPQKEVEYWSIISNVRRNRNVKIKVVLKKIGAGQIMFWSVMKLKN